MSPHSARQTSGSPHGPEQRLFLSVTQFMAAEARSRRGPDQLEQLMGEIRASLPGGKVTAMMRLFQGYTD